MAITLNSGFKMPIIGLGVWRMDGKDIRNLLIEAIKIAHYRNEVVVGEALAEAFQTGLVKREELFITTKIMGMLSRLATEEASAGVSGSAPSSLPHCHKAYCNYDIFLTRDCLAYSKIKPAVNQIETHPYFQRESLVKFCQKHGICVTAHTPLEGSVSNTEWFGSVPCLDDPAFKDLAEIYKKTVPQTVLRWGIQRNTIVIPKTSKVERLEENFKVFDLELSKEDMDLIGRLDRKHRTNQPAKLWGIDLYAFEDSMFY